MKNPSGFSEFAVDIVTKGYPATHMDMIGFPLDEPVKVFVEIGDGEVEKRPVGVLVVVPLTALLNWKPRSLLVDGRPYLADTPPEAFVFMTKYWCEEKQKTTQREEWFVVNMCRHQLD